MKLLPTLAGLVAAFFGTVASGETLRLQVQPDQGVLPTGKAQEIVLKIDLTSVPVKKGRRLPLNLAVVLDRSGSMAGAKIEKAKQAALGLIDQLAPGDIFSLVAYDNQVDVLVRAQPLEDREMLRSRVNRIQPGGGTALYGGVERGAAELERYMSREKVNRVILLSDGLANVGPSSTSDLKDLGRRLSRTGLSVSTIGVGDDYNEDLMSGLAEASDANYYYVRDAEKLPEIFAKELGSLLAITAREVRIEIICPEGIEPLELIGRPERFEQRRAVVEFSPFASGQNRFLFVRCRVSAREKIQPVDVATVQVSYRDELDGAATRNITQSARVEFTEKQAEAVASINPGVAAQRELMLNALASDKAIEDVDRGDTRQAISVLKAAGSKLEAVAAAAPVEMRAEIKDAAKAQMERAKRIEAGAYEPAMRKEIKSESYTRKNAK